MHTTKTFLATTRVHLQTGYEHMTGATYFTLSAGPRNLHLLHPGRSTSSLLTSVHCSLSLRTFSATSGDRQERRPDHDENTATVLEAEMVFTTTRAQGETSQDDHSASRHIEARGDVFEGEITTDTPRQPQAAFFSAGLSDLVKEMEALVVDIKKAAKHVLWFGDRSSSASYLRSARSLPDDEHKPIFRRTFLNAAAEYLPITRRTPPSVREKEVSAVRIMRAKEDVVNYKKPIEERLEDIQRPKSLAEWGGYVEAKIREEMDSFTGSSVNLIELCNQPEYNNPYLDSTTRIMYRMMKRNDCLPYWLQLDKDIKEATEALRADLKELKKQWQRDLPPYNQDVDNKEATEAPSPETTSTQITPTTLLRWFEQSRVWRDEATQERLARKVKKINSQILNFNLSAPHMNFHKFNVGLDQELAALFVPE